jgi:hypothetical protein
MGSHSPFFVGIIAFVLVFAILGILTILEIVYMSKVQKALNNSDVSTAKSNFAIASGFVYFFAAFALLVAFSGAVYAGVGAGAAVAVAKGMADEAQVSRRRESIPLMPPTFNGLQRRSPQ